MKFFLYPLLFTSATLESAVSELQWIIRQNPLIVNQNAKVDLYWTGGDKNQPFEISLQTWSNTTLIKTLDLISVRTRVYKWNWSIVPALVLPPYSYTLRIAQGNDSDSIPLKIVNGRPQVVNTTGSDPGEGTGRDGRGECSEFGSDSCLDSGAEMAIAIAVPFVVLTLAAMTFLLVMMMKRRRAARKHALGMREREMHGEDESVYTASTSSETLSSTVKGKNRLRDDAEYEATPPYAPWCRFVGNYRVV